MNEINKQQNTETSLTAEERGAMKQEFVAFMDANPEPVKKRINVLSPYFPHMVRVPVFAVLTLMVMGGTAFAAEYSLPNDLLYPVKTEILEPLFIEASAVTPLAKAEASQELIERRLEEAGVMINQNEFEAKASLSIAAAIDEHTHEVQAFIEQASQAGELSDALDVGSNLENALEAHGEVLESIAKDSTATETVEGFIESVANQADEAELASENLEQDIIDAVNEETENYLNKTVTEAQSTINSLRASLSNFVGQNEELITEATSLLTRSEAAYEAGTSYLNLGQRSAAIPQLREALQLAQQGSILIESHEELNLEETDSNP